MNHKRGFKMTTLTAVGWGRNRIFVVWCQTFGPVAVTSTRQEAYEEQVDYEFGGGWKRFLKSEFGYEVVE